MLKKFLCFSIILFISIALCNISFATDVVMDLDNPDNNQVQTIDDTTYSSNSDTEVNSNTEQDGESQIVTTTSDYDDSVDLSITNMINIILIVVGVVLILLGIAIIIKK